MPRKPGPPTYLPNPGGDGKIRARTKLFGRTVSLGDYGSPESYQKFARVQAEYAATLANGGKPPPAVGLTVGDLCLRYQSHAEAYYRDADGRPTPEVRDTFQSLRPLRRLYGPTPAAEFSPLKLKAVRQAMIDGSWLTAEEKAGREEGGWKTKWSRKLVNQRVGRVVRAFKWAASEELLPHAVWVALKAVQGLRQGRSQAAEREDVPPVAQEVVQATLPRLGPVLRAMVELQLLTGMRPGEVCALKPAMIDREGLKVDGVTIWVVRFGKKHKTGWRGHEKAVAVGPRAQAVLLPFLERDPEAYLFSPREAMDRLRADRRAARKTPVQPSQRSRKRKADPKRGPGERYTADSYGKRVKAVCRRHGIEPWHPGQLRHTAATAAQHAHGIDGARALLGHRDAQTTLIYAERDMHTAAEIAAKMG